MKKEILFLMMLFLINLISASYTCSTTFTDSVKVIQLYELKYINGINIALTFSFGPSNPQAEIILEARKFLMSNSTPIELNPGYNLTLSSIQNNKATLAINEISKTFDNLNADSIKGYEVFILNAQGTFPGTGNLETIIGSKRFTISSGKSEIVTINNTKYLLQLESASPADAVINVRKCDGNIIEITNPVIENNNTLEIIPNNTIENTTLTENNSNFNITIPSNNITNPPIPAKSYSTTSYIILFSSIAALIFAILIYLIYLLKNHKK